MSAYLQRLYGRVAAMRPAASTTAPQPSARLSSPLAAADQRLHGGGLDGLFSVPVDSGEAPEVAPADAPLSPPRARPSRQTPMPDAKVSDLSPVSPDQAPAPSQPRPAAEAKVVSQPDPVADAEPAPTAEPSPAPDTAPFVPLDFGIEPGDFEPVRVAHPEADNDGPATPEERPAQAAMPEPAPAPEAEPQPAAAEATPASFIADDDPGDAAAMQRLAGKLAAAMAGVQQPPEAQPTARETITEIPQAAEPAVRAEPVEAEAAQPAFADLPGETSTTPSVVIDRVVIETAPEPVKEAAREATPAWQAPRTAAAASAIGPLPGRRMPASLFGMRRR